MRENNYTSLELSKRLAENGCDLESDYYWAHILGEEKERLIHISELADIEITAYDILNDICVKYVKEFFGALPLRELIKTTNKILLLQRKGLKKEVEDYIWEWCLFNPKNKE